MSLTLGQFVRQKRKETGMTQEELASKAGVATNTIRRIEADRNFPTYETVKKLAAVLNVEPTILITGGKLTLTQPSEPYNDVVLHKFYEYEKDKQSLPQQMWITIEHNYFKLLNDNGKEALFNYSQDLIEIEKYRNQ